MANFPPVRGGRARPALAPPSDPLTLILVGGLLALNAVVTMLISWQIGLSPSTASLYQSLLSSAGGLALGGLVGAVALAATMAYWRQAVYLVFVLLFVEGLLRNYLSSPVVLLVKDALLGAIYLRVFGGRLLRGQSPIPANPMNVPVALFTLVVALQSLNPNVGSLAQVLVGVRTWLMYVPLIYVAQEMFTSEAEIWRFVRFILICAIGICAVTWAQYLAGPDAYASLGPGFAGSIFMYSDPSIDLRVYRPNATFAWSTHAAIFLTLALFLCLGAALARRGGTGRLWLLFGFIATTIVVQGQRTLIVLLPPLVVVVLMLCGRRLTQNTLIALLVVAFLVAAGTFALDQVTGFGAGQRVLRLFIQDESSGAGVRTATYLVELGRALEVSPIGAGLGATSIGTRYVSEAGSVPLFVEFWPAKVIAELSVFGLLAYLLAVGTLALMALSVAWRATILRLDSLAALGAVSFAFCLFLIYFGTELPIAAIPLWFLGGISAWVWQHLAQADTTRPAVPRVARPVPASSGGA